jgi:hypothetical protein
VIAEMESTMKVLWVAKKWLLDSPGGVRKWSKSNSYCCGWNGAAKSNSYW